MKSRRSLYRKRRRSDHTVDDWLMTYADMITLLLCFFAIFLSVSVPKKIEMDVAADRVREQFAGVPKQKVDDVIAIGEGNPADTHIMDAFPSFIDQFHTGEGQSIGDGIDAGEGASEGFGEGQKDYNQKAQTNEGGPEKALTTSRPFDFDYEVFKGDVVGGAFDQAKGDSRSQEKISVGADSNASTAKGRDAQAGRNASSNAAPEGDRISVIDIPSTAFFESGSADISASGRQILQSIVTPQLKAALAEGFQLTVEGHTDNVPIHTAQFPSNWELSTARAAAVVRALIAMGISPQNLRASGYADSQPKLSNDTADNRAQNRRVVLRLEKMHR
jgi:flagellar motor protein MotB